MPPIYFTGANPVRQPDGLIVITLSAPRERDAKPEIVERLACHDEGADALIEALRQVRA